MVGTTHKSVSSVSIPLHCMDSLYTDALVRQLSALNPHSFTVWAILTLADVYQSRFTEGTGLAELVIFHESQRANVGIPALSTETVSEFFFHPNADAGRVGSLL